jgi:sulfur carrier protein
MEGDMEIVLNGRTRAANEGQSLATLVNALGFDAAHVAIEYNGRVLERREFAEIWPAQGDRLEIVRFVGGG